VVFIVSREVVLDKTRLGRFYRTTVPESVRKFLNVCQGDYVEWVFNDGKIYVRKALSSSGGGGFERG
jgi:bifunctional DNA-binding transcriptional regulator/antitoxin component of YhaV-PrlF toxin-antitoxin module